MKTTFFTAKTMAIGEVMGQQQHALNNGEVVGMVTFDVV